MPMMAALSVRLVMSDMMALLVMTDIPRALANQRDRSMLLALSVLLTMSALPALLVLPAFPARYRVSASPVGSDEMTEPAEQPEPA